MVPPELWVFVSFLFFMRDRHELARLMLELSGHEVRTGTGTAVAHGRISGGAAA
jgi:hypothetical protein